MKTLILIDLLIISVLMASPSLADAGNKSTSHQSVSWEGTWKAFKTDWQEIGKGMKQTGVHIGRTFKNEFKKMPDDFRKGCKAAKKDIQAFTSSPEKHPSKK